MPYDRDDYRTNQVLDYISVFYPELKKDFKDCRVLDVGCGLGTVSLSLSPYARSVLGIDPSNAGIAKATKEAERQKASNVRFVVMSAYDMEPTEQFDVVLLSDVLEHVPDQRRLLEKSVRMLAPGGVMYLNTPNKWFPMEPHVRLPFVSYLPRGLANSYAKAFGRKSGYDPFHLLSYGELTGLLDSLPVTYSFKTQRSPRRLMYKLGNKLVSNAPFMWRFANAFQVVIQRK